MNRERAFDLFMGFGFDDAVLDIVDSKSIVVPNYTFSRRPIIIWSMGIHRFMDAFQKGKIPENSFCIFVNCKRGFSSEELQWFKKKMSEDWQKCMYDFYRRVFAGERNLQGLFFNTVFCRYIKRGKTSFEEELDALSAIEIEIDALRGLNGLCVSGRRDIIVRPSEALKLAQDIGASFVELDIGHFPFNSKEFWSVVSSHASAIPKDH